MWRSYIPALSMFLWYKSSLISVVDNFSNASEFITKIVWVKMLETLNLNRYIKRAPGGKKWIVNRGNREMNLKGLFYRIFCLAVCFTRNIIILLFLKREIGFVRAATDICIVWSVKVDWNLRMIFYLVLLSNGYAKKHWCITLDEHLDIYSLRKA